MCHYPGGSEMFGAPDLRPLRITQYPGLPYGCPMVAGRIGGQLTRLRHSRLRNIGDALKLLFLPRYGRRNDGIQPVSDQVYLSPFVAPTNLEERR